MKWIKCSDRLPEEGEEVLTVNDDNRMNIDYVISHPTLDPPYIWACILCDDVLRVSHWMDLPELPEGD